MDLFNRSNDNGAERIDEDSTEEPEELTKDDLPEAPTVTLVKDKEYTYEYTEHEATAGFSDGTTREFTFDAMEETSSAYVLKDYDSFGVVSGMHVNGFRPTKVRKTATLVKRNLNFLETTNRIEREETTTKHEEREDTPLPEALYYTETHPDTYSFDSSEVPNGAIEEWDPMMNYPQP